MSPKSLFALVASFGCICSFAACGSDGGKSASSCSTDDNCKRGYICDNKSCVQLPCQGNGDCVNGDQACISVGANEFCSAVECGCANCDPCPVGEVCDNGICGQPTSCGPAAPCGGTRVCDNGTCRDCQGAECAASDCTTAGCPDGKTCNTTTKECESAVVTAEPCDSCTKQEDCPDGWKCIPLASGQACLAPCSSNNDCDTGWECQNTVCSPAGGRCEGCYLSGCGDGQACNANTRVCGQAVAECATCTSDWECGDGRACKSSECVDRCNGTSCPSGGGCAATATNIQVCQNGCAAGCDPACSGGTPICDGTRCVQCRTKDDCSNGQTCDGSGLCVGTVNCVPPKPVLWNGQCVECVSNDNCPGKFCDIQNHVCTDSQCASCADPYPACVTIGNDSYCVQCATNEDCGVNGTCNQSTYACEGGTVEPTEKCTEDADCDSGASTGFTLTCHKPSGLCVDAAGSCDDVTAFCVNAAGVQTTCVSFFEMFGGGAGIELPPDLAGGGTIPGFCACTCDIPGVCLGPGDCRAGTGNCADLAALLSSGASSNPVCFNLGL